MRKSISLLTLLMFATVLVAPTRVHACSCLQATNAERLESHDLALTAQVSKISKSGSTTTATLDAYQWFKGKPAAFQIEVSSTGDSAMCGVEFEKDAIMLVFASKEDGKYTTNLCSGTGRIIEESGATNLEIDAQLSELETLAKAKYDYQDYRLTTISNGTSSASSTTTSPAISSGQVSQTLSDLSTRSNIAIVLSLLSAIGVVGVTAISFSMRRK